MRRAFVCCLPWLVLGCGGGGETPEEVETVDWGGVRPPNVVVVLLDTLRADALSIYGDQPEIAPFLTGLAQESAVFDAAFSTSTWTAPATASILTGCYPDRHGVTRGFLAHFREGEGGQVGEEALETIELHGISSTTPTLAERFRKLGYATYGIATNVNIGAEMEFDRGFDRFERHHQASAKVVRERLLTWKDELTGEQPVFLYLHLNDVHEPYEARPRWLREFDPEDQVARAYAYYRSEIGYVDSFLARLFGDFGWGRDTLVAVLADHGEEFMDHGQMAHEFSLYSELARVPMLLYGPSLGITPQRVTENVSVVDLVPTLLGLLGRPAEDLDGRSLAGRIQRSDGAQDPADGRPLFLHRFERGRHLWGVVFEHWKLIQHEGGAVELYDLARDPGERQNLAAAQPDRCDRLLSLLEQHQGRGMRTESKRADVAIDQAMLEQLKSLGYVK
ncbi:MAG: sulfatase [Planctomycetota bacterium]|nr:sulfatase [Planctomycetota bacterium]